MLEADQPKLDVETYADTVLTTAAPPMTPGQFKLGCLQHAAEGCASEAGELLDAVKRVAYYGKELDRTNVIEECGDLLWYLAYAIRAVDGTFEEVMLANIAKLRKRYPEGTFSLALSESRDVVAERTVLEEFTK